MIIKVNRKWYTEKSTIGLLSIDGIKCCFTLEDCKRDDGVKIDGQTAIPAGEYPVILDYSNRFKKIMPHVLNVPGFEGIRIHCGNTDADTEGCLLVGSNKGVDEIFNCLSVFTYIFGCIQKAIDNKEDVTLWIINDSAL